MATSARRAILVTSRPRRDFCPVAETARIIGKKWYLIILHNLDGDALGFNELKRRVTGISAKVLSESLSSLEAQGLITRNVYSDSPIRVEYAMNAKGRELGEIFHAMNDWGQKWLDCPA